MAEYSKQDIDRLVKVVTKFDKQMQKHGVNNISTNELFSISWPIREVVALFERKYWQFNPHNKQT
jgi:hypothetical protein